MLKQFIIKVIPKDYYFLLLTIYWRVSGFLKRVKGIRLDNSHSNILNCRIAYNSYGGYCVPLSTVDRPASQKVLSGKVHEPGTIRYMLERCHDGDIVHAGAFFGDFIPALSSGLTDSALVWAFEPNRESYRCAKLTLEINNISNVKLFHAGLGEKSSRSSIRINDAEGRPLGGSSAILNATDDDVEDSQTESVDIKSIDEIIPKDRKVSIIQLDVEGFELPALKGAINTIRRNLPVIILEVLPGNDFLDSGWFKDNILELDYTQISEVHGNSIFICRETIK